MENRYSDFYHSVDTLCVDVGVFTTKQLVNHRLGGMGWGHSLSESVIKK